MNWRFLASLFFLCTAAIVSVAQTGIITDRPDFTESGVVVPSGTLQLEAGATYESDATSAISGPEMLGRLGIGRHVELRLGVPDYVDEDGGRSGFGDASVGIKVQLTPDSGGWSAATILSTSVPTGEVHLSNDELVPEIIQAFGLNLSGHWSIGAQASAALEADDGDGRAVSYAATVVAGRSLTQTASAFLEVALSVPEVGQAAAVTVHHGYTLLIGDSTQLDLHAGTGITDRAPDFFVGFGLSTRLEL